MRTTRRSRFAAMLATAVVLAGGVVFAAGTGGDRGDTFTASGAVLVASNGQGNGNGNGNGSQGKAFTLSGSAQGLYPGAALPLVVTINNPNAQAMRVSNIRVAAGNAGGCTSKVTVDPQVGSVVVPGNSSGTTTLTIRMAASAGMECRNQTFPLTYTARGEQA